GCEPGCVNSTVQLDGTASFDPETGTYYVSSVTLPYAAKLLKSSVPSVDYLREMTPVETMQGVPLWKPHYGRITPIASALTRTDLAFEHFLDRREEVGQGANHGQRGSVGRTEEATCCRQYQGVFDSLQGYAALMQLGGQQAVGLVHTAGGSRSFAVGLKNSSY